MRKLSWFLCLMILILTSAEVVSALPVTFSDLYPSNKSTVIASKGFFGSSTGYYFSESLSHSVSQTFQGTGLQHANRVDLSFGISENFLIKNNTINWNVFINDTLVGRWVWGAADKVGKADLSFSFGDIVGDGDYTLSMRVANNVADGSIAIGLNGLMKLYGDSESTKPVPEPASILLFGIGLVGIATIKKTLKK